VLDSAACISIANRPSDGLRRQIVGGVHTPSEDSADCYRFSIGLLDRMRAAGPENRCLFDTSIQGLRVSQGDIIGVETSAGLLQADAYLLASGCDSARLARPLGLALPIYPLKGYSLTAPISDPNAAPTLSVTDFQRKIVYARLDADNCALPALPISAATAAPSRRSGWQPCSPKHVPLSLLRPITSRLEGWAGLRPATPSGRPILGHSPYRKLWLNVGHGALGFTLSLASGRALADLICGQSPFVALDGFTLAGAGQGRRKRVLSACARPDDLLGQSIEKDHHLQHFARVAKRPEPFLEDGADFASAIQLRQRAIDGQAHVRIAAHHQTVGLVGELIITDGVFRTAATEQRSGDQYRAIRGIGGCLLALQGRQGFLVVLDLEHLQSQRSCRRRVGPLLFRSSFRRRRQCAAP
jgi:hypothetical protein